MKNKHSFIPGRLMLLLVFCIFYTTMNAQKNNSFACSAFKNKVVLKFEGTIEDSIKGKFIIMKGHADEKDKQIPFSGNRQGDMFTIRFKTKPRPLSDNTKWSNRPWKIITVDRTDTLQVIFLELNSETKKWEEVTYEFIEEQDEYSATHTATLIIKIHDEPRK